jgi:hypothetical protein
MSIKIFFAGILKVTDEKSRIRMQDPHAHPANPDPRLLVKGTDPRIIRISIKMSRIRTTVKNQNFLVQFDPDPDPRASILAKMDEFQGIRAKKLHRFETHITIRNRKVHEREICFTLTIG